MNRAIFAVQATAFEKNKSFQIIYIQEVIDNKILTHLLSILQTVINVKENHFITRIGNCQRKKFTWARNAPEALGVAHI
jgi:hypothetical protein